MGRLFWISFGAFLGLYGRHKAKQTVDRYVPPAVSRTVISSVKRFVGDVAKAQYEARSYLKKKRDQTDTEPERR
jgi:hypothetical protein